MFSQIFVVVFFLSLSKSSPPPFAFEHLGRLAHDTSQAHLIIDVNIGDVIESQRRIIDEFQNLSAPSPSVTAPDIHFHVLFRRSLTKMSFAVDLSSTLINDVIFFLEWNSTLLPTIENEQSRHKRQAAAIGSIFSLGLTIIEEWQIQSLIRANAREQHKIQEIVHVVRDHANKIKANADAIAALKTDYQSAIGALYEHQRLAAALISVNAFLTTHVIDVERFALSIFALATGFLPPALINPAKLLSNFESLRHKAATHGLVPVSTPSHSLFQSKISISVSHNSLYILVHVPLRGDEFFELFRYISIPYPITNVTAARIETDQRYIAVDKDHARHIPLTDYDIAKCSTSEDTWTCTENSMTINDIDRSCIGTLFTGRSQKIRHVCTINLIKLESTHTARLATCTWSILAPNDGRDMMLSCSEGARTSVRIQGPFTLSLNTSCRATIESFSFYCPIAIDQRANNVIQIPNSLPRSISHLFEAKSDVLDQLMIHWASDKPNAEAPLSLDEAESLTDEHLNWPIVGTIAAAIALSVGGILGGVIFYICKKRVPRRPPSSATRDGAEHRTDIERQTTPTKTSRLSIADAANNI